MKNLNSSSCSSGNSQPLIIDLLAEQKRMTVILRSLPDCDFQPTNFHQKQELKGFKERWKWIGWQIEYLQLIQLGCSPKEIKEPCKSTALNPAEAEFLLIFSRFLFQILQLLIGTPGEEMTGFSLIKDWATKTGRDFPFKGPIELFIQICRDYANEGWNVSINDPPPIIDMRHDWHKQSKFLRGNLEEEEAVILHSYGQDDWLLAWMVGIYGYRFKKPLQGKFKEFLDAHKAAVSLICDKKPRYGARRLIQEEIKINDRLTQRPDDCLT
jgi:hypothetical protein